MLSDAEFEFVRTLVHEESGMTIDPGKKYLAESRLASLARRLGFESDRALLARTNASGDSQLRQCIVEAMTIHETSFFRDLSAFNALRENVLPRLIDARKSERRLRIWSAACSSGQEPYSLAMMIHEHFPELLEWDCRIVASDFSSDILERAAAGRFSQVEVNRGLPVHCLVRFFRQVGHEWQIESAVRDLIEFRHLNLAAAWPGLESFDLVLLRNVMIYFDIDARRGILKKVRNQLRTDGYLVLGGTETTLYIDDEFTTCPEMSPCGFYRLIGSKGGRHDAA